MMGGDEIFMTEISKSNFLAAKDAAMISGLQDQEVKRRLSLYQVFLSLYERHSSLLNEILQLENLSQPSLSEWKPGYFQGVIDATTVYVITNLGDNQTQTLQQSQHIWTIGSDRSNGICAYDQHLSRYHAAIQYIENQGFHLIDFKSTNGSFLNGEPIYEPIQLQDGDRIRLGTMTFDFFFSNKCRTLPTLASNLLTYLIPHIANSQEESLSNVYDMKKYLTEKLDETVEISMNSEVENIEYSHSGLSADQKSEILDRFFNMTKLYRSR